MTAHPHFLSVLLFALCTGLAHAQTTLVVAPSHLFFNYTEFDTNNKQLNNERGGIPGLQLSLNTNISERVSASLHATHFENDVSYTGLTNKGEQHSTRTDEKITSHGAQLNIRIAKNNHVQLDNFLALRQNEWQRDIRPRGNIAGLFEVYDWLETAIGLRLTIEHSPSLSWVVEASRLHTGLFEQHPPTIYIDLSQNGGTNTTLNIGPEYGSRISLAINKQLLPKLSLGIKSYYESWDFGRSNTVITYVGTVQVAVTEPRSETRNHGFQLNISYML